MTRLEVSIGNIVSWRSPGLETNLHGEIIWLFNQGRTVLIRGNDKQEYHISTYRLTRIK